MSSKEHNQDDVDYAFETTKILREPDRFIDTFGLTRFEFIIVSEQMDSVGKIRIRSGVVEAQKPQIIKPDPYISIDYEGFSSESQEEAEKFFAWMKNNGHNLAFLQYGFQFKKRSTKEETIHDSVENVTGRLLEEAQQVGNPALAILEGVDESWDVSLLKFTIQMIAKSRDVNVSDYRRSGLL